MDMERGPEEVALGALGLAGFCRKTLRVVRSRPPGFAFLAGGVTMLTLSLLAHIAISRSLFPDAFGSSHAGAGLLRLATNWAPFFLLEVAYLLVIVVQWLGATICCVFSVAPRYGVTDDRDTGDLRTIPRFRGDSRSAALQVAGRLAAICLLLLGYTALTGASAWLAHGHLLNAAPGEKSGVKLARVALPLLGGVVYFAGARHIGLVWRVASVMVVLEDAWSFRALHMSEELLHLARMSWAPAAVLTLDGCILAVQLAFGALVVDDVMGLGVWLRVAAGVVMAVALWAAVMAGMVAQVLLFFVCKSYHREREL
ncbi:hypothetical protein CFC21_111112 [Triticum aestivum]|nr:uncharacterized protein LOC109776658 [Aegilops tauschii subsp. strangulata]KAF7111062.1 hypothetical protein CFC21_111112 [Triticum aestivum]